MDDKEAQVGKPRNKSTENPEGLQYQLPEELGSTRSTRREFARTLAALAATPLLRPVIPFSGTDRAPATAPARADAPIPAEPPASTAERLQAQTPAETLPEAEALSEVVRIQYGKNLSAEQMAEVKRSLSGRFRSAEAMKKVKLENGDEPAFVFSANP